MFIKVFLYLIIFSILHFSYDITGFTFLKPFGGVDESIFQHLKMAFWSYIIASLIEYSYTKKKFKSLKSFFVPRLFSAIIVPWIIVIIWYIVPATYGRFHNVSLELFWALIVTILSGISGVIIERSIQGREHTISFIIMVIIFAIISSFLYIRFTYSLPWIDLFQNPEGL